MFYTASNQGGSDYATFEEAVEAADWQGQFCSCCVFSSEGGNMEAPLYEAHPEDDLGGKLVENQNKIRSVIESWAKNQSSSISVACARADFECAVLEALRGGDGWQYNTNADLCAALGNSTLDRYVEDI